jgi:hypothetical protein
MFASYLRCVCSGLCDKLITRSEKCARAGVCLMLCDLGASTTQPRPELACRTTDKEKYMVVAGSDPVFK